MRASPTPELFYEDIQRPKKWLTVFCYDFNTEDSQPQDLSSECCASRRALFQIGSAADLCPGQDPCRLAHADVERRSQRPLESLVFNSQRVGSRFHIHESEVTALIGGNLSFDLRSLVD